MRTYRSMMIALSVVVLAGWGVAQAGTPQLILHGAIYDPSHILDQPDLREASPFTGAYFHGVADDFPGSGYHWINRSVFAPEEIDPCEYEVLIGNCQAVAALPDNPIVNSFLSVTTIPGTLSQQVPPEEGVPWDGFTMWNSDFSSVVNNIGVAAKVAKDSGLVGILLDLEPYYGSRIWEYAFQDDQGSLTYEEFLAQVRIRGEQFIEAINAEYPDMVLLIIPGCYGWYGDLQNAFCDGIFAEADPAMTIIDGQERYGDYTLSEFQSRYDNVKTGVVTSGYVASDVISTYQSRVQVSFGLWLEHPGNESLWDCETGHTNVTAAQWKQRILDAYSVADSDYIWIYNWNGTTFFPDHWWQSCLPQDYIDATFEAYGEVRGAYCGDATHAYPTGDLNKDCHVDMVDFSIMSMRWMAGM